MKVRQNKKQLLAFYMLGFLIGILYANLSAKQYMNSSGIFNEYFLHQYAQTEVIVEDYIWYIMGVRLVPFIIFCVLGLTKIRKVVVAATLLWTGFSSGMLAVSSVIKLGMRGIVLCIVGITPQFLCYTLAYIVLMWYFYAYTQSKWNLGKTVFICLVFAMGIVLEGYVNPILMKMFIKTI